MRERICKSKIKISMAIIMIFIGIQLFPFVKGIYNNEKVIKHTFINKYFIIAKNNEMIIDELKEYMKNDGFKFFEVSNDNYIFRKDNIQREIGVKDIIKVII